MMVRAKTLVILAGLTLAVGCSGGPTPVDATDSSKTETAMPQKSVGNTNMEQMIGLTDFTSNDETGLWETVNDNVMGGRSKGGFRIEGGALKFTGSTNTNGGGFSSIRRSIEAGALKGADVIAIRVRGDGRTYKLSLMTGEKTGYMPVAYRADFSTTQDGHWQELRINLDQFKATAYGRTLSGYTLDPARVDSVGLMVYDGKDGDFSLEVAWIKACMPAQPMGE